MKLSKALKEKNRTAAKISEKLTKAVNNNSYLVGSVNYVDSKDLLAEVMSETIAFAKFKAKLFNATHAIREDIFLLSEYRNLLKVIKGMSTTEGAVAESYSAATREYAVKVNAKEKDDYIATLEECIDELQERIDLFNATTELPE